MNEKYNEDLIEQKLQIMEVVEDALNKRRAESNYCFSFFIFVLCIWILFIAYWQDHSKPIPESSMTYGIELIAILMLVAVRLKTSIKLSEMGINKKNLKASLIRAIIISILFVFIGIGLKLLTHPGEAIINWSKFNIFYLVTSLFQEFIARGFLVTCLSDIYSNKYKNHLAVLLSSILFAALHLYYGFNFMIGAGALSILLGYVYLLDKNIWGVTIIHFIIGTIGFITQLV